MARHPGQDDHADTGRQPLAPASDDVLRSRPQSDHLGLAEKLMALGRTQTYRQPPGLIEVRETHMSFVILTDRHAYKLKKPVRYPFLDFSTLESRRDDCSEEVRLNRRLAPDVYLGVTALVLAADGSLKLGGEGTVVEWLVEMRRLPADRMLDHLIQQDGVSLADMQAVARTLNAFYRRCDPVPVTAADYRTRIGSTVETTRRALLEPKYQLPADRVGEIADVLQDFIEHAAPVLDRRIDDGRIVEGHGDLRPEHVCVTGQDPVVIDCLEFNRDFRITDPCDELAFLALDCERLGAAWPWDVLFGVYRAENGDPVPDDLLRFYAACKALVRAKIAVWHLDEPHVRHPQRWPTQAAAYLDLAERHAARLGVRT